MLYSCTHMTSVGVKGLSPLPWIPTVYVAQRTAPGETWTTRYRQHVMAGLYQIGWAMHPGLAANDLLHGRHDKLSNETMSPLCRSALNRLNSSMSARAPLRLADFSDNARCRQTVAVL